MYGTVARLRLKPGAEAQLAALEETFRARRVPGFVAENVYRMDADPGEYYLVAVFESREAYVANANSPEQHAEYQRMLTPLEGEPERHDGEIVVAPGTEPW